jgi:hypothetical protein
MARRRGKKKLTCACGATADLRKSEKAWYGWQVAPTAVCPSCIDKGLLEKGIRVRESQSMGKIIRIFELVSAS